MSSTTAKSFLIKDILSETSPSSSSDDESDESKEVFLSNPIDLRRYFKHPLCPIAMRSGPIFRSKATPSYRNAHPRTHETNNSPLNALFEMTKKTFDKSDIGKCAWFQSVSSPLFTWLHSCPNWLSNPLWKVKCLTCPTPDNQSKKFISISIFTHASCPEISRFLSLVIRRNEWIELPIKHVPHRSLSLSRVDVDQLQLFGLEQQTHAFWRMMMTNECLPISFSVFSSRAEERDSHH